MANTVHCRKYGEELPALTTPPFPGPAGEKIMQTVSAKAWEEWTEHQKRLINEKHLSASRHRVIPHLRLHKYTIDHG